MGLEQISNINIENFTTIDGNETTAIVWADGAAGKTPLNADNLNKIEHRLKSVQDDIYPTVIKLVDKTNTVFESINKAQTYVQSGKAYIGQRLTITGDAVMDYQIEGFSTDGNGTRTAKLRAANNFKSLIIGDKENIKLSDYRIAINETGSGDVATEINDDSINTGYITAREEITIGGTKLTEAELKKILTFISTLSVEEKT